MSTTPDQLKPLAVSEEEAAELCGVCASTLRYRRVRGLLPANLWTQFSPRRITYSVSLLARWVELGCPPSWPAA